MSCLGVHFALTDAEVANLCTIQDEQQRLAHLQEVIEPHYLNEQPEFAAESDKAWDAMHRTLADGLLTWTGGEYPLNHVVLGGKLVYSQSDYIMSLKSPTQVKDVAVALAQVSEATFRERYFRIDPAQYGVDLSDEDFGYTWEWFQNVRGLYERAAADGRHVLFTADQ